MTWTNGKFISGINVVRINQKVEGGGNSVGVPERIEFRWEEFVLSVSRTRAMQTQVDGLSLERRLRLIEDYGARIASAIDVFVDEASQEFSFRIDLYILPDDERPSFAGNVGAAVADLVMEKLGFHWRANAAELKLLPIGHTPINGKKRKTPDYVYDPGRKHNFESGSVVIVEAKGSLSPTAAGEAAIKRRARDAYKNQVRKFIGVTSQGVTVANGFAIAFGSVPGTRSSRVAIASPQTILIGDSHDHATDASASAAAAAG